MIPGTACACAGRTGEANDDREDHWSHPYARVSDCLTCAFGRWQDYSCQFPTWGLTFHSNPEGLVRVPVYCGLPFAGPTTLTVGQMRVVRAPVGSERVSEVQDIEPFGVRGLDILFQIPQTRTESPTRLRAGRTFLLRRTVARRTIHTLAGCTTATGSKTFSIANRPRVRGLHTV